MKTETIVIKSDRCSLLPHEDIAKFEWDADTYSHSEEALKHIELLMISGQSFSVRTSTMDDIHDRRSEIVFGRLLQQTRHGGERRSK